MIEADALIDAKDWKPTTKATRARILRRLLVWLWQEHGARKLDGYVHARPPVRPRMRTVEREVIDKLLNGAPPYMRLWLLLCSDLAIRSGTASRLGPWDYNRETQEFRFATKYEERLSLPATAEIVALVEQCNHNRNESFVRQLWRCESYRARDYATDDSIHTQLEQKFTALKARLGVAEDIRPHDLRRTTAVAMLEETHDVRMVQSLLGHSTLQSTIWYLDHDLKPIKRSTLEILKRPAWHKEQTA